MSKKKILMYNGGKDSFYYSDDPKVLTNGTLYDVIAEKDLGFQTNYTLNGIEGEFNSVWFSEPISYFAYTDTVPVEGEALKSFIRFEGIHPKSMITTSTIRYVEAVSNDIYKVYTQNTLYIVKVLKEES